MPGVVQPPDPFGTLAHSLSSKFTESHNAQVLINEYADGFCQRGSLVTSGRRSWSISKRLTVAQLQELRTFWESARGRPFYFYNPSETNPPYSHNPDGTSGRYIVRFSSDWDQTNGMVKSEAGFDIIELASAEEIAAPPASGETNSSVPGQVTVFITTEHIPNPDFTPFPGVQVSTQPVSVFFGSDMFQTSAAWAKRTDSKVFSSFTDWSGFVLVSMDHVGLGETTILDPPDEVRVYDAWAVVVYGDGTVVTTRPTTFSPVLNGNGDVLNPENAIDGDASTYASVSRNMYHTNQLPTALILSSFR